MFRSGRIASSSCGPEGGWAQYLINANVYSGDSGAPVFVASKHGAPELIGLVCERIGPKTDEVPLAVALNAAAIRETLAMLPSKEASQPQEAIPLGSQLATKGRSASAVKLIAPGDMLAKIVNAKSRMDIPVRRERELR